MRRERTGALLWVPVCLFLTGCATMGTGLSREQFDLLPRQSPDAAEVLLLQSNVNCQFFVDSQPLAIGRRVRIVVTKASHQVTCKPDGYRAKEEYLQPPFDPNYPIGFTFLLEDRLPEGKPASEGAAPAARVEEAVMPSDADNPPRTRTKAMKDAAAVVIGIEKYRDLPKVDFAARDAETVKRYLVESMGYPEENVAVLTNERATRSDLEAYLGAWLKNNVTPGGKVFVFFAGHGSPDPTNGDAFMVPFDGNPSFLKSSAYPLKKLYADLAMLPTKDILVVMDSCFSGAGGRSVIAKGTRPLVTKVDDSAPADGIVVLSAASGEQISSFYPDKRHGMLTYFFLKGLQGEADGDRSGSVTLTELYDYLRPKVTQMARKLNNVEQTPQLAPPADRLGDRAGMTLLDLAR
ncbi:MAG: caspase family protein [Elusimicrobia bacterium]|nr:caspase family protein [Elusimicrobiota bacterium]